MKKTSQKLLVFMHMYMYVYKRHIPGSRLIPAFVYMHMLLVYMHMHHVYMHMLLVYMNMLLEYMHMYMYVYKRHIPGSLLTINANIDAHMHT